MQSTYLKNLKETLSPDTAVLLMDFSENYSFVIQNEAQGYHWTHGNCTVCPAIIYFKHGTSDQPLSVSSHCYLSDDLDHDVSMVYKYQQLLMQYINEHIPTVKNIHYFTDGCAAQYKNCKTFLNLCHHKDDFGLSATWSFFATSHGKSACDGIGGTVKRLTTKASLQHPFQDQIITVKDMFAYCITNISNIKFHYVEKREIDVIRQTLNTRYAMAKTIPGTRGFHSFSPLSFCEIGVKRTSQQETFSLIFNFD